MSIIILAGLELRTQEELARVFTGQGHQVVVDWRDALASADVLFCNADDPAHPDLVRKVRTLRPDLPVVAVTGFPEPAKWLDALDAGAQDYCCAPFETLQLAWLLSGVLEHAPFQTRNQAPSGTSKS